MTDIEEFPDVNYATEDGLLALGGDLSPSRLLAAYKKGIFPWYNPGEPILWWSPDPRCVIFPETYQPSRSLRKSIRKQDFKFSFDQDFAGVIKSCAIPRSSDCGTWITADMMKAYIELHKLGIAHSVETWREGKLVGGLYGISLGTAFFGESMFNTITDASKAALYFLIANLVNWHYEIIDCQITSNHLLSLGAEKISRSEFIQYLEKALSNNVDAWNKSKINPSLKPLLKQN